MTPFPPPQPGEQQPAPTGDAATPASRRGRTVAIVAAVGALGLAGVAAGSQLVSADDEPIEDDEPSSPVDTSNDESPTDDDGNRPDVDDGVPGDGQTEDGSVHDEDGGPAHGEFDFDLGDLGLDVAEWETAFEEFDACLAGQLPDFTQVIDESIGDLDDVFGDITQGDWAIDMNELVGDSVTVFDVDSDDPISVLDFGEGDGEITITRTDGEITIETSGDVETIELPDFGEIGGPLPHSGDVEFGDLGEFGDAIGECEQFLPDGGIFDIVGEVIGG